MSIVSSVHRQGQLQNFKQTSASETPPNLTFEVSTYFLCENNDKINSFGDGPKKKLKVDLVGSAVRYEVMELCTGSEEDSNVWYLLALS